MLKVAVLGASGRMGRAILACISEAKDDLRLTGALTEALTESVVACTTACCSGCPHSHAHEAAHPGEATVVADDHAHVAVTA